MSMLGKLVAARHLDGRVIKGRTADFKPNTPSFHVRGDDGKLVAITTAKLKAVFFIKNAEGDPDHNQVNAFPERNAAEKKIWVTFKDGEALAGWSSAFAGAGSGFFFTPTDPKSNLERVYAYRAAIRDLLVGDDAERAAEKAARRPRKGRQTSGIGPFVID
jgi:hypothetical protein